MATAFNEKERTAISEMLIAAAQKYAASVGMKHTSVDFLAKEAGISKGAFYSFYETKEELFLAMFERMHFHMYGNAEKALKAHRQLPQKQRAFKAIQEAYHVFAHYDLITFMQEDLPVLLRKLPKSVLDEHYHDDEKHIKALLTHSGITLTTSIETACAVLRLLILTPMLEREIGEGYPAAMDILIQSVCNYLVA